MAVIESEREIKAVSVILFFLVEHNKQQTLWSRCNVTLTSVSSESGSRLKGWTVSVCETVVVVSELSSALCWSQALRHCLWTTVVRGRRGPTVVPEGLVKSLDRSREVGSPWTKKRVLENECLCHESDWIGIVGAVNILLSSTLIFFLALGPLCLRLLRTNSDDLASQRWQITHAA